jgi:ABC-2 type transport system ATP-binding protein
MPRQPRTNKNLDMSDETLVVVKDLARRYGPIEAVKGIDFTIRKGEVLGFLGPNGAGKTTTMQMLSGNLAPTRGHIAIAGHDLLAEPRRAKAQLGYLPETPPLYRELTVDEYLDYCAALNRVPRADVTKARETAKQKCGLTDVGARLIGNLSKGYQQRVGLAQAIIHLPPLVILDEPTVGLDPLQIREIRALIRELGREHGVILSTHILPEVQAVCDRVQIIHQGELVLNDSVGNLASHLKSSRLTLGLRTAPDLALLRALPGVHEAATLENGRVRVLFDPARDPSDAIVKLAAERGWGLYEIAPERVSLEQLFVELTTPEPAAEAANP